ncbi:hypothetical protein RFM98_03740 [Mesorhizobium sp. VK9D]|uniref:hypothetical protein n=1 Tax=Mesorhizobium australafricanum TaxID=3072311 RepID=UPI002A23EB36|nr:hypothetical protein [Mesorhizobium sp. VK9D]MDX8451859.1 hypothetical protein [Mesorhizobium sp. VK9D]
MRSAAFGTIAGIRAPIRQVADILTASISEFVSVKHRKRSQLAGPSPTVVKQSLGIATRSGAKPKGSCVTFAEKCSGAGSAPLAALRSHGVEN